MKKLLYLVMIFSLIIPLNLPSKLLAAEGITLFTPYTGVAVTPGENISYSIDVINDSSQVQQLDLSVSNLPDDWTYTLSSGGFSIKQLSVHPDEKETFKLDIEAPLQIEKGTYNFRVVAKSSSGATTTLPISVEITEQGVFKTDLSSDQLNMQGDVDSTFSYKLDLTNKTADTQNYSLQASAPRGWQVTFKADGQNVTSVSVESGESKTVDVDVGPAENTKEGTYEIPVIAQSGQTQSEVTLEAVITGKYNLNFSTVDGRLSEDIQAGKKTTLQLVVENTGTTDLKDITFTSNTPSEWEVEFSTDKINELKPGEKQTVQATVTASDRAIAGDYVLSLKANSPEVSKEAQFRMSVKTSMLWGWVGILIIVAVAVSLVFLIRKYGRR
ncbi:COG1470 family protein [Bacillaceae bacterium W0354]